MEMSNAIDDGGPAFPAVDSSDGMTLRDYFAAKVLQTELLTCGIPGESLDALLNALKPGEDIVAHIARNSYEMADAMIEARKVKP